MLTVYWQNSISYVNLQMYFIQNRWLDRALWTPSRTYDREANSVGREYDAWSSVSQTSLFNYLIKYELLLLLDVDYLMVISYHAGGNIRVLLGRAHSLGILPVSAA